MRYKVALPRDSELEAVRIHRVGRVTQEEHEVELTEAQVASLRRKHFRVRKVTVKLAAEPVETVEVIVADGEQVEIDDPMVGGAAEEIASEGAEGVSDGDQNEQ